MEYPFKDLLPLDEVLEREGYYRDWTHLDPEVFYSLTQISEYIKTKGYGVDVRLLIAQLAEHFSLKTAQINEIERLFNDVMKELSEEKDYHSLPEIAGARGGYETLGARLNNTTARIDSLSRLSEGSTTGDAELIDARVGADGITYDTAGGAIRGQINKVNNDLAEHKEEYTAQFNKGFPSQAKDLMNNRAYTIELQLSSEGNPQLISKEVV